MTCKYVFGPIPSRRLGLSLGVDLMPHKTCTLDCVYCECGKTTRLTLSRKEYVPVQRIVDELCSILASRPKLDFITFSGSGEPTLHGGLSEIADFINKKFPDYRLALLTNGTLFGQQALRSQMAGIDVIVASLDAATESVFRNINRPHPELTAASLIDGLTALRREYPGQLWLEVFLVPGINDTKDELCRIRDAIRLIRPEKVQLNTLDRPGTEDWVRPMEGAAMDRAAACIQAELPRSPSSRQCSSDWGDASERLMAAIHRRPCTVRDLTRMLGLGEKAVKDLLSPLLFAKRVEEKHMDRGIFYLPVMK